MKITFEGNFVQVVNEMRTFLHSNENVISTSEGFNFKKVVLPVRSNKHFTEFEIDFLKENYKKKSITWIAAKLSRKKEQVYSQLHKMYKLGLPTKNNKPKIL